jgi:hypothetical protein
MNGVAQGIFTPPKVGVGLDIMIRGTNQLEEIIKKILDPDQRRVFWSFLR